MSRTVRRNPVAKQSALNKNAAGPHSDKAKSYSMPVVCTTCHGNAMYDKLGVCPKCRGEGWYWS